MKKIKKYLRVLNILIKNAFLVNTNRKFGFLIFFTGKILRFLLYFLFIFYALAGSKKLVGYNSDQVVFFFLTYTLIDSLSQLLFRNVYTFRNLVVSGSFDLFLSKPLNPLFRILLGGIDLIDAATLPLFLGLVIYWGPRLHPAPSLIIVYVFLIINSLFLAAAFHIAVVSLAIITLEIDHSIMIFRDLENMARFPVDIYQEPLRSILTFVVPIGLMMTIPAKALMGLVSFRGIVASFLLTILVLIVSFKFWHFALKRYTSASS